MRVILLGPPGSGKGTQGDLIAEKYGFPKISTGDLLRESIQKKTPLGKEAEAVIKRGELVSDDIVIRMVRETIFNGAHRKGYTLDGFPRTLSQAKSLDEMDSRSPEIVLDIRLDESILIKRLSARWICSNCQSIYNLLIRRPKKEKVCDICGGELIQRKDDRQEVIKERLKVYHDQTEPLLDYYQQKSVYHRINGQGNVAAVFHEISSVLDEAVASSGKTGADA